jgi:hypothetical protein
VQRAREIITFTYLKAGQVLCDARDGGEGDTQAPAIAVVVIPTTLDQRDIAGTIETVTAYVISDVVGRDPELVARYRDWPGASIERYGGRYARALDRNLIIVVGADEQ